MMKKTILFFIFVFFVPLAWAIDCSDTIDPQMCHEIKQSELSEEEQEYLLADLLQELKNYPNHEFVREWNLNLPPPEVAKQNKGYIRNVWVKLIAVMPAVLENGGLLVDKEGEVLSDYKHEVKLPSGKASGDCRTEYHLKENTGRFRAFVNDVPLSGDKLASFNLELPDGSEMAFRVVYDILVKVDIKHFVWKEDWKGRAICEYSRTEHKSSRLVLEDSLTARQLNKPLEASFELFDTYSDTMKGTLSHSNFSSLFLEFPDASLEEHHYLYGLKNEEEVLTITAEPFVSRKVENVNVDNDTVVAPASDSCLIRLYNHFNEEVFDCSLSFEDLEIVIDTDKFVYEDGETIEVSVSADERLNLEYGEESFEVLGNVELTAKYTHNKLMIKQGKKSYEKLIHVKNKEPWTVLFSFGIFGSVNYVLVGFLRKYWGVLL